jgi:prolyl oligopeptidase
MAEKFDWDKHSRSAYDAYMARDYRLAARLLRKWFPHIERFGANDERLGYAYWLLGISLKMLEKYEEAPFYFLRAARIYTRLKKPLALDSLWWLASCYEDQNNFKKAARYYIQVAEFSLILGSLHSHWPCPALTQAGYCYWRGSQFEPALETFARALQMAANEHTPLIAVSQAATKLISLANSELNASSDIFKLATRASKLVEDKLSALSAPATEMRPQADKYFGHIINDPFRWLEDTQSEEAKKWIQAQTQHAEQYLHQIPGRAEVLSRINKMFEVEPLQISYKVGKYYFSQNRPMTQLRRSSRRGRFEKLVLDTSHLSPDSLLLSTSISKNGEYVAYWVAQKGSDWQSIHVRNMSTGKDIRGVLHNLRACRITWKSDNSGFYYTAFSKSSNHKRIMFHKLGTAQLRDIFIWEMDDPGVYAGISIVCDGKYLLVTTSGTKSHRYSVFLVALTSRRYERYQLMPEQKSYFYFIGQKKDQLFFITNKNAPMLRIVSVNAGKLQPRNKTAIRFRPRVEVAEKRGLLKRAFVWGDYLFCLYSTPKGQVIETIRVEDGVKLNRVELPTGTSVLDLRFMDFPSVRLLVEGYTIPSRIYNFNLRTASLDLIKPLQLMFNMDQFVTEKLYTSSHDGRRIPFYVRYKKGLKLNGSNPTILSGYGGFNKSIEPAFDYYDLLWMELGGVCAEAVLRGDSGLGEQWRKEGTRENKQNTFNDFIAVAKALVQMKFTQPSRLGIKGFSNGGLLAAAVLTQRPTLFGAVAIGSGLIDMLRYHHYGTEKHFAAEYGSAVNKKDFEILRAYSPLHRVQEQAYPPVLITTGSHDDRVNPAHSYKFAATLQHLQRSAAPILLYVIMDSGHSTNKPSMMGVDRMTFFGHALGLMPGCFLKERPHSRG